MKLILQNGYPYPCPEGFDPEKEGHDCRYYELELVGVKHFEWKYELTIEFKDRAAFNYAAELTGWPQYGHYAMILAPRYSSEDGYEAPAIIAGDKAYCGFILMEE